MKTSNSVLKPVMLLLTSFVIASSRTRKNAVDHSHKSLERGRNCYNDLPQLGNHGYSKLTKNNVTVTFIKDNNSCIARFKWTAPVYNGFPVDSYIFKWGSSGHWTSYCIRLRNTTTTYAIKESPRWQPNWDLFISIQPLPGNKTGDNNAMEFYPACHDSSREKPSLTTFKDRITTPKTIYIQSNTSREFQDDNEAESASEIVIISVTAVLSVIILVTVAIMLIRRFNRITDYFVGRPRRAIVMASTSYTPALGSPDDEVIIYVSYSPEPTSFNNTVIEFTSWFREQGYDAQVDLMLGPDNELLLKELGRIRFGELQLQRAKYIFMIVSPAYLNLCQQNGDEIHFDLLSDKEKIVYSEIMYIRNELCVKVFRNSRFLPVLFGVEETALPFWMKELVVFSWPDDKKNQRLLYRLNEQLEYTTASTTDSANI